MSSSSRLSSQQKFFQPSLIVYSKTGPVNHSIPQNEFLKSMLLSKVTAQKLVF